MSTMQTALERAPRFNLRALSIQRIFPRCENEGCAKEGNLWPSIRRRSSGIQIEGRWVCGSECFEESVSEILKRIVPRANRWKPKVHRLPIGLVLLSRGVIRDEQLREALERQRQAGSHRLGYWLQETGAATEDEITSALAAQWACPVFPLAKESSYQQCAWMLPEAVIRAARMLPVYVSRDRSEIYLAFVDGVDHSWLWAAGKILGCRTAPCLVSRSSFDRAFEEVCSRTRTEEFLFDSVEDIRDMARVTTSFTLQLRAKSVQMVGCREFAWARIESQGAVRDLLFHLPIAH